MTEHDIEIALLKKEVERLNGKLDDLSSDVRDLANAWKAAGALVAFVKTAAAVVLAVSVLVGAFKFGFGGPAK